MPRINQTKTNARDARQFADWLTACTFENESEEIMDPIALLPRRSLSTEVEHAEWRTGARKRRPLARESYIVLTLSDGRTEYLTGNRYNVRAAYLRYPCDSEVYIIALRWTSTPLHRLSA